MTSKSVDLEPKNRRRHSAISNKFVRTMLIGLIIDLALLSGPMDSIADQELTIHMFQHIGIFAGSIVFGYALDRYLATKLPVLKEKFYLGWKFWVLMVKANVGTKGLVLGAILPAVVFTFWHAPSNFDLAATNGYVHLLEHMSYMVVGGVVGMTIVAIPKKIRTVLLTIGFMEAGMMGSMMLLWPSFYPVYSAAQNLEMDTALMLFGAAGIISTSSALLKQLDIL